MHALAQELFENAKYPDRVFAGVVQQKADDDPDCLEDYCELAPDCRRNQVKITNVPLNLSRGVMPARYRQHGMIEDHEFCMQVNSA